MFTIEKELGFEAAHRLPHHQGKCARLHGHSYKVVVRISKEVLPDEGPSAGMVMDFYDVKTFAGKIVDDLDHRFLNDVPGLENPTGENIALWLFNRLASVMPSLESITVRETCTASATYTRHR